MGGGELLGLPQFEKQEQRFMMEYSIVKFGSSALRAKAQPVQDVDDNIRQVVADMLDCMHRADGIGLAAEQVGRTESLCMIELPKSMKSDVPMPLVMINPVIVDGQGEVYEQEGCLSFPDIYVKVKRMAEVTAEYTDQAGKRQSITADGLLARAIQHELDHLNGVLLVDHMTAVQKVANAGKLKRLRRKAKRTL
jgi:peptide deformylase